MSILDRVLVYDVETTVYKHQERNEEGLFNPKDKIGQAFCEPQQLVMSGFKWLNEEPETYGGKPPALNATQMFFNESSLIVGFNIKFDLHWARRIGVDISNVTIWDCQLAEFLLSKQQLKYPSMNGVCDKYSIPNKLDVVSQEYWEKGLDTDEVPHDILQEYLEGDLDRTEQIFKRQLFLLKGIQL